MKTINDELKEVDDSLKKIKKQLEESARMIPVLSPSLPSEDEDAYLKYANDEASQ